MCWIWLFLAISLEVAATILMKLSDGLTRALPTVGMLVFYALSFVPMTIALREMEIGVVYAIWSAVGTAVVAFLGVVVFHESASILKVVAIGLIILGVICLNISTPQESPSRSRAHVQLQSELRLDRSPMVKTGRVIASRSASASVPSTTSP